MKVKVGESASSKAAAFVNVLQLLRTELEPAASGVSLSIEVINLVSVPTIKFRT